MCDWGGGGGGYSHFFFIRRIGPSIYRLPQKKIGNIKHPKKYLNFFLPRKIFSFCTFSLRTDPQYIEKTPKTSPILSWPQKISTKSSYPQNINISETPQNNVIQKFKPKKKKKKKKNPSLRMYQTVSEPPPPLVVFSLTRVLTRGLSKVCSVFQK